MSLPLADLFWAYVAREPEWRAPKLSERFYLVAPFAHTREFPRQFRPKAVLFVQHPPGAPLARDARDDWESLEKGATEFELLPLLYGDADRDVYTEDGFHEGVAFDFCLAGGTRRTLPDALFWPLRSLKWFRGETRVVPQRLFPQLEFFLDEGSPEEQFFRLELPVAEPVANVGGIFALFDEPVVTAEYELVDPGAPEDPRFDPSVFERIFPRVFWQLVPCPGLRVRVIVVGALGEPDLWGLLTGMGARGFAPSVGVLRDASARLR